LEKGLLPDDLAGELALVELELLKGGAVILEFAIDFDKDAEAEDTVFMTAEEAAEALLFSLLPLNSSSNREPAALDALVPCTGIGIAQLWSAGNR